MLSTLYLLRYNNYYNRIVKKENTLDDYLAFSVGALEGVSFNPADGIHTEHVCNFDADNIPDYVVETDGDNNIISRWFVLEAGRNLKGQYYLRLRRDVCVDFYDKIVTSTAFIERGTLDPADPLIYNPEAVTFNQIKKSETLLKDRSQCAWVVGYLDSGASDITATASLSPAIFETKATLADFSLSNGVSYTDIIAQSDGGGYHLAYDSDVKLSVALCQLKDRVTLRGTSLPLKSSALVAATAANGSWAHTNVAGMPGASAKNSYSPTDYTTTSTDGSPGDLWRGNYGRIYTTDSTAAFPNFGAYVNGRLDYSTIRPALKTWLNTNVTYQGQQAKFLFMDGSTSQSQYNEMLALNGKYIKTSTDSKIYKILCYTQDEALASYQYTPSKRYIGTYITPTNSPTIFSACDDAVKWACSQNNIQYVERSYENVQAYEVEYQTSIRVYFSAVDVTEDVGCTLNLGSESDRIHPIDAPYDIFCIPYNKDTSVEVYDGNSVAYNITPDLAINLASELSRKYSGAGTLYDVQLLPYCPVQSYGIIIDGRINIEAIKGDTKRFKPIMFEDVQIGCAFMVDKAAFSFNIPYSISVENVKVENQTDMYRLCSPNYSGLFEFNAAKNGGVDYVNVDCTYIPHNPYIHLNINFKNLYGADFNDVRGLVCGGDFSLPTLTDAWETYQLQNKNYQAMFDRQIKSMDIEHSIQRTEANFQALSGLLTGTAAGAQAGGSHPIVGGIMGGLASAGGAVLDWKHLRQRQEEQKSYATDMHTLQLGNVQALPTTLSRSTAYTYNNKIFPFVEFYSCTDAERQAFVDKLKWEGMTIGRHDIIANYISNQPQFLRATLKRLEGLADEYHVINVISEELQKGVYI